MNLSAKTCFVCENGAPPMPHLTIQKFIKEVNKDWQVKDDHEITREFKLKDFKASMKLVNKIADIAETEGHHPDLYIFYNIVKVKFYTHAVNGLSENDFYMAAKIDEIK